VTQAAASPECVRARAGDARLTLPSASPAVDWEKLGFGLTPTAAMYVATCAHGQEVTESAALLAAPLR